MTIPTYITLARMCMVPFYGAFLILYGKTMLAGTPDDGLRIWACFLFAVAAMTDALDGFVARVFEMRSQLGAYLDPFADKMLLLTSIIFMGAYHPDWWQLPIWFVGLVVARDVLIIYGVWRIKKENKPIYFAPHWTGKMCTLSQIVVVSAYLLNWEKVGFLVTLLASVFTIWSGIFYVRTGLTLLRQPSSSRP